MGSGVCVEVVIILVVVFLACTISANYGDDNADF